MIICHLGRQPELSIAELNALYPNKVNTLGREFALVDVATESFDIQKLGGTQKAGIIIAEYETNDWRSVSRRLLTDFVAEHQDSDHKVTLGISCYGFSRLRSRDINETGLAIKQQLKRSGVSVRLITNHDIALPTATSHHNKLGLNPNKIELIALKRGQKTIVARSLGAQNITAYARRDQNRPARDAFVGMLPPKLAQIMLNLAIGDATAKQHVLDPFCGTGVVLQEASLMGHTVYGSDLNPKMIDYTTKNLDWLHDTHKNYPLGTISTITEGDAMATRWPYAKKLNAVVCETYLGQPFSATPSPKKLHEVRGNCNHIISTFLKNISKQITPGTRLTVAVPAWRDLKTGRITRLSLATDMQKNEDYTLLNPHSLLYYREDQVVARDILVLEKR